MDSVENVIKALINFLEYYEQAKPEGGDMSFYKVIDPSSLHFLLIASGFENSIPFYRVIFHFHLLENSLSIIRNTTDVDLEEAFQEYGIRELKLSYPEQKLPTNTN
ncbi:MAG: XisI protein [Leptospiraceae bacterium]|nr:XisI protein [Leptospiraceae bacterium]MCP5501083.1 XisI protein [Leptospiraceae bacterium]